MMIVLEKGCDRMKLVAIAGSIGEQSYNRMLVEYLRRHFQKIVTIEVLDLREVPVFNEDQDLSASPVLQELNQKIKAADGVILATPEHNHTIPAAMKNLIEWFSFKLHPFDGKPIWVIGASYYNQGTSRAQLHLKQILEAPHVNGIVMPGNEFLLSNAKTAFNEAVDLRDAKTVAFLEQILQKFLKFVRVIEQLE